MMNFIKKGFTLIELLIVIAIIGILSGIVITNVQGVRQRARDARRKSDFDAIAQSLRIYYNDYQKFPRSDGSNNILGCGLAGTSACTWGTGAFATTGATPVTYLNRLPYDPSSTSTSPVRYIYFSATDDNFTLTATLENASDPDINDSQTRCGSGSGNQYVVCP